METPRQIGRYEILREIGRGAMGLVYLAHDPRIDRRVAIKTIHALNVLPPAEAEEIRRRFTREAQAAGRLQHPGIVTIFDVGEHEGTYFIAMEYIEGDTLEPYTRRSNLLPPGTTLSLVAQACEALDYAHQQSIVHRDIKPANLMMVKGGRIKITDFGLAKNPQTNLTHDGVLIGTPNYMSPEQITGKPLDGRSDLFSLAAVTYELLTGEKPFSGESVTTIIYRILHEQPREARSINEKVPEELSAVLLKALAKDPSARYQTGHDLAVALQGRVLAVAAGAGASSAGALTLEERLRAPSEDPSESIWSPVKRPKRAPSPTRRSPTREAAAPRETVRVEAGAVHSRLRAAFILSGTIAAVLLVPGSATIDDRWGRGDASGKIPFYRTAGIVSGAPGGAAPPGGGPPRVRQTPAPAVALPGDAASVTVSWRTVPAGGRIYLDDVEIPAGDARLPRTDSGTHTVVAENDCFIEKVSWKLGKAGREGRDEIHTIALKTPKVAEIPVTTTPAGARLLLDGRDTGLTSPAGISAAVCGSHTVAAKLSGYVDAAATIEGAASPLSLTLKRIPEGMVKLSTPYPVEILAAGKRIGRSGEVLKLPAGRQKLVLRNEDLFVERTVEVEVAPDRTVSPQAGLPGLGNLTVLASPSNCNIYVNGREVGAPPINKLQLAAGTYTIKAVYVPTGETKEQTVTIAAGDGARVPFKFSP